MAKTIKLVPIPSCFACVDLSLLLKIYNCTQILKKGIKKGTILDGVYNYHDPAEPQATLLSPSNFSIFSIWLKIPSNWHEHGEAKETREYADYEANA